MSKCLSKVKNIFCCPFRACGKLCRNKKSRSGSKDGGEKDVLDDENPLAAKPILSPDSIYDERHQRGGADARDKSVKDALREDKKSHEAQKKDGTSSQVSVKPAHKKNKRKK